MSISVTIEPDADGFVGRECPECEKYFKIRPGTGLPGQVPCHCPYCNHLGPQDEYWTKQQIEYAKSVALRDVSKALLSQLKPLERKPDRNSFISIGIKVSGRSTPVAYYSEKELETRVVCDSCTLEYAIYGTFGYCPDCGIHNSNQILNTNFDLILKMLDLAADEAGALSQMLIDNALEDSVSCFDAYGRDQASSSVANLSFQNIEAAKQKLQAAIGIDISSNISPPEWSFVTEQFQVRHLLAHKMGIIDDEFIRKTGCSRELIGRRAAVTDAKVRQLIEHLRKVGETLYVGISRS